MMKRSYVCGKASNISNIINRCIVTNTMSSNLSQFPANFFHSRRSFSSSSSFLIFLTITSRPDMVFVSTVGACLWLSLPSVSLIFILWSPSVWACSWMLPFSSEKGSTSFLYGLLAHVILQDKQVCSLLSQPGICRRGYTWWQLSTAIWRAILSPQIHMIVVRYMAGNKIILYQFRWPFYQFFYTYCKSVYCLVWKRTTI